MLKLHLKLLMSTLFSLYLCANAQSGQSYKGAIDQDEEDLSSEIRIYTKSVAALEERFSAFGGKKKTPLSEMDYYLGRIPHSLLTENSSTIFACVDYYDVRSRLELERAHLEKLLEKQRAQKSSR